MHGDQAVMEQAAGATASGSRAEAAAESEMVEQQTDVLPNASNNEKADTTNPSPLAAKGTATSIKVETQTGVVAGAVRVAASDRMEPALRQPVARP